MRLATKEALAALTCAIVPPVVGAGLGGASPGPAGSVHPLIEAGVQRGLAEWARGIREPPQGNPAEIQKYLNHCGGPWARTVYRQNGDTQWCGMFVAWALQLNAEVSMYHMPGSARLVSGHWERGHWAGGTSRVGGPRRFVEPTAARRGDVFILRKQNGDRTGYHIGLVVNVKPGEGVYSVEGNSFGQGPNGARFEGVVQHFRPFRPRNASEGFLGYVIRPVPELDFR